MKTKSIMIYNYALPANRKQLEAILPFCFREFAEFPQMSAYSERQMLKDF